LETRGAERLLCVARGPQRNLPICLKKETKKILKIGRQNPQRGAVRNQFAKKKGGGTFIGIRRGEIASFSALSRAKVSVGSNDYVYLLKIAISLATADWRARRGGHNSHNLS